MTGSNVVRVVAAASMGGDRTKLGSAQLGKVWRLMG
jgi:hypothetical protein